MSSTSSRGSSARGKICQADLELRVLGGEINPVFDQDKENIVLQLTQSRGSGYNTLDRSQVTPRVAVRP